MKELSDANALHELVNGVFGAGSDLWTGTYYAGTTNGYHIIVHTRRLVKDQVYSISTNHLQVIGPFPPVSGIDEMMPISQFRKGDVIDAARREVVPKESLLPHRMDSDFSVEDYMAPTLESSGLSR